MNNIITNIIGIVIMIILYSSLNKKNKDVFFDQKLFINLMQSIIFILIIDTIPWIINEKIFTGAVQLNIIFNAILFFFDPLPGVLWACYVHYKIYQNREKLKSQVIFILIPMLINGILAIASLSNNVYFTVNESNVYYRNDLGWVSYILALSYLAYTIVISINNRKFIRKEDAKSFILFAIIPLIFSLTQMIFKGISLMWVGVAIACITVFIKVQNDMASTDFLTGLNNRGHLERYLRVICGKKETDNVIAGLMLDIDHFKDINDTYGHAMGDKILIDLSRCFERSLKYGDFLSRYAGDEFVIIAKIKTSAEVQILINTLHDNVNAYNEKSDNPFSVDFSIGFVIYRNDETIDDFLKRVDEKMYEDKNRKRLNGMSKR